MKTIHQTIFGPPDGNCWQAATASILNLGLDEVPNFVTFDDWDAEFLRFLREHDLYPIYLEVEKSEDWKPLGFHLITGESPRGEYDHVIVGKNGKAYFDPFPGGDCQLESLRYYIIFAARLIRSQKVDNLEQLKSYVEKVEAEEL